MRRLIIEEPYSRSATWSRRIALFGALVTGIAVYLIRSGSVDAEAGFAVMFAGFAVLLAALGLAILGFVSVWRHGRRGVARAGIASAIVLAVLAFPAWLAAGALTLPVLRDVTTDVADPPAFSRSGAALNARGGFVPPDPDPATRLAQRRAYPQVAPVYLDAEPGEAFEIVRRAVTARGMDIVEAVPPGGRLGQARIEAVDSTLLLNLSDDVTIRIRPRTNGVRIDIRSASRFGLHDLGANARRVMGLIEEISAQAVSF